MGNNKTFMSGGSTNNGVTESLDQIKAEIGEIKTSTIPDQTTEINAHTTSVGEATVSGIGSGITVLGENLKNAVSGAVAAENAKFDEVLASITTVNNAVAGVAAVGPKVDELNTAIVGDNGIKHQTTKVYEWFELDTLGNAVGATAQKITKINNETNGLSISVPEIKLGVTSINTKVDTVEAILNEVNNKVSGVAKEDRVNEKFEEILNSLNTNSGVTETTQSQVTEIINVLGGFQPSDGENAGTTVSGAISGLADSVTIVSTTTKDIQNEVSEIKEAMVGVSDAVNTSIDGSTSAVRSAVMDLQTGSQLTISGVIDAIAEETKKVDAIQQAINAFEASVGSKNATAENTVIARLDRIEKAISGLLNN